MPPSLGQHCAASHAKKVFLALGGCPCGTSLSISLVAHLTGWLKPDFVLAILWEVVQDSESSAPLLAKDTLKSLLAMSTPTHCVFIVLGD